VTILLLQSLSNFFQTGSCAIIVQFGSGCSGGANRANNLIVELNYHAAAKEHDMRSLASGAIEFSPLARSASASVSFLKETLVYALS
jgi:hypothetical protein